MSDTVRLNQLLNLLKEQPEDGFLLFAVAKEYEQQLNLDDALAYYEKLRAADPDYVGVYYHLAQLYRELDDVEKAIHIYDQGIQIAEKLHDLHALSELRSAKMNLEMEM